jgi:hypothetical protein
VVCRLGLEREANGARAAVGCENGQDWGAFFARAARTIEMCSLDAGSGKHSAPAQIVW